ncbi:hypothetical protein [Hymenobacter koreensis]|uniref:DUF3298 domain-containing protein n=1 Tax=Hymenobacter koreensis TaxID=1084523 RepID=A0ABP8JNA5_9BACT
MECQPQPLLIPDPMLAQMPVHQLLAAFATELPWLSHAYGLAQTGQRKVENRTERYAQIYQQDGSGRLLDIRPDAGMQALCFFERNGPSSFEWDEGAIGISGSWTHPLALVLWANLPAIDHRGYDYSDALVSDAVRVLTQTAPNAEVVTDERRSDEVFRRYGWDVAQHQLMTYPYAAARLVFFAHSPGLVSCQGPFAVLNGPLDCAPNLRA